MIPVNHLSGRLLLECVGKEILDTTFAFLPETEAEVAFLVFEDMEKRNIDWMVERVEGLHRASFYAHDNKEFFGALPIHSGDKLMATGKTMSEAVLRGALVAVRRWKL